VLSFARPTRSISRASTIGCARQTDAYLAFGTLHSTVLLPVFSSPLRRNPYAVVDAQRFVILFFSADRAFDPKRSADQDFGGNRILLSASHEYALTFHTDRFAKVDVETLHSHGARTRSLGNASFERG